VLTASSVINAERAKDLFEAAYDEHARRLAELYKDAGAPKPLKGSCNTQPSLVEAPYNWGSK
jgi:hypothetical protein